MYMKKVILLLHGLKKYNKDDFSHLEEFFNEYSNEYDINNITWYNNYDKKTMNLKHLARVLDSVSYDINRKGYKEIVIVAYSTGNIIANKLIQQLTYPDRVKLFGVVPAVEVTPEDWVDGAKEALAKKKEIQSKLGNKRFKILYKKMIEAKKSEQYPVKMIQYVYKKIIAPEGHSLGLIENGKFLLAKNDSVVKNDITEAILKENGTNKVTIKEFSHQEALKQDKEVFIDWFRKEFK